MCYLETFPATNSPPQRLMTEKSQKAPSPERGLRQQHISELSGWKPSIVIKRRLCPHRVVLMDLIQNKRGDSWVIRTLDIFGPGDNASTPKSKPFFTLHSVHYLIWGGLSTCIIIAAYEKQAQKSSLTLCWSIVLKEQGSELPVSLTDSERLSWAEGKSSFCMVHFSVDWYPNLLKSVPQDPGSSPTSAHQSAHHSWH
jgi:hypothetical protein